MYKHILIAVDDSDTSHQALQEAIKLTKEHHAKLRIIHIADEQLIDYLGVGIDYNMYATSMKGYGQKILKNMKKIARQANIEFDTQLIELKTFQGRIEEKIIEAAEAWPADLLVMGTHGRRGFNHFLLGSVAEGVVRIAPIPVLLIRGKPVETPQKKHFGA